MERYGRRSFFWAGPVAFVARRHQTCAWKKYKEAILLELETSFVEDPPVWVEKQIKNNGQPKSHRTGAKRRKPARLLKRSTSMEISGRERDVAFI